MKIPLFGVAGLLSLACSASIAVAQSNHVAWSKIETGPWMMHPIYTEQPDGSASVTSFLALADPSIAVGNNLIAVWFIKEPTGWVTKAWTSPNPWDAIEAVKDLLSISDDEDDRWDVEQGESLIHAAPPPSAYTNGVLESDPLSAVISTSPDRDFVIEILTQAGYAAADVPLEKEDGCDRDDKLNGMVAAINETLKGDETTAVDRSMTAWIASGTAGCGIGALAVEIVKLPPRPASPWTPFVYSCGSVTLPNFITSWPSFTSCTTQVWTETRTWLQTRTRAQLNPAPPPVYQFCDQLRTKTESNTFTCTICVAGLTPVPCPPVVPGVVPLVGACAPGWLLAQIGFKGIWGPWGPDCPF